MEILLISNEDGWGRGMGEEVVERFGRGMNICRGGVMEGNWVGDVVWNVMEEKG